MNKKVGSTIAVGMSGGVDSSVCALLLQQQGYTVVGVTYSFFAPCGGEDNEAQAKAVAKTLGIEHYSADLSDKFLQNVINPFVSAYEQGETPNPCVMCNQNVKFGQEALQLTDTDLFATGHYARITLDKGSGRYLLQQGKYLPKDQSYFLAGLSQAQLAKACFPLGDYSKEEIRQIAQEAKLPTANRSDSQDICFIPDGDYAGFICKKRGKIFPKGYFVDTKDRVLGEHQGIIHYTVGQRRGLGISSEGRLYVKEVNTESNKVVLCNNEELFSSVMTASRLNFVAASHLKQPVKCVAKIRSRHLGDKAVAEQVGEDEIRVEFEKPQRAITVGQTVVLYEGDTVLASGVIQSSGIL